MNLSARLKTSCAVYRLTSSGAPLNTETWALNRTIMIMPDYNRQSIRYNDDGKVINSDAMIYTFWTSDLDESDRYSFGGKYYSTISLVDPNGLGLEARIYLKRLVGGVSDN